MFFVMNDIDFANYADDNTPHVSSDSIEDVIRILQNDSIKLVKWFSDNMMKANKDKCHLKLDNIEIENYNCERLLGVTINSKLNFKEHLDGIIKKASRKINALSSIASYMNIAKRRLLMNSFFASQFNYCPLVWMCHHRSVNTQINRLHERCLRIVYSHSVSSFEDLLGKDRSVTAQKMKIFIKDFFSKCDQIRSFLRIWSHLLKKSLMKNFTFEVENLTTISAFKREVKNWKIRKLSM